LQMAGSHRVGALRFISTIRREISHQGRGDRIEKVVWQFVRCGGVWPMEGPAAGESSGNSSARTGITR
jgi:hypothetical protein